MSTDTEFLKKHAERENRLAWLNTRCLEFSAFYSKRNESAHDLEQRVQAELAMEACLDALEVMFKPGTAP